MTQEPIHPKFTLNHLGTVLERRMAKDHLLLVGGAELGRGMLVEPDYVLIYPLPVKGRRRAKDHLLLLLVELTWVR